MADGDRHEVRIVKETSYGVTPTSPEFTPLRTTGCTLATAKNTFQSEETRPDRQISDFRHGSFTTAGDITGELTYDTFNLLLEAALGGAFQTDTPAAGTDRLSVGTNRDSFTVERFFSDIATSGNPYHRFLGQEVNTFNLTVPVEGAVTAGFGFFGREQSAPAGAILSGATYLAKNTNRMMDSFTGVISEGGVAIGYVSEVTLTLENGLAGRPVIGDRKTLRPNTRKSNLTGQITAYFEDSTLLSKFLNETASSLDFTLSDPAGNTYRFFIPRILYTGGQTDVQGAGDITVPLPFQAVFDSTEATNFIIDKTDA